MGKKLKEYEIDENVIDLDKFLEVKTRHLFEETIEFTADTDFDVSFTVDNSWFDPDYNNE